MRETLEGALTSIASLLLSSSGELLSNKMCRIDVMLTWHLLICAREEESTLGRRNFKTELSLWKHVKCLPSTLLRRNFLTRNNHRSVLHLCICVWGKLGQGNIMIIVMSPFTKSFFFKLFAVYTKTENQPFLFPQDWRTYSKSSVFVTD